MRQTARREMRRLAISAFAVLALATLSGPATAQESRQAAAGKAKPSLVRVEILTRSQSGVARKGLVRARIAFKGRGVVRVGGRVRAGSRSLKLFRAKAPAAPPARHTHRGPEAHAKRHRRATQGPRWLRVLDGARERHLS